MVITTIKRKYGKLNENVLMEALGQGKTYVEAGRLAGSKATSDNVVNNIVVKKIQHKEELKKGILLRYEELEARMMAEVEKKDLTGLAVNQLVVGMAVLRDKITILKGDMSNRSDTIPQLFFQEFVTINPPKPPTQIEGGQAQKK